MKTNKNREKANKNGRKKEGEGKRVKTEGKDVGEKGKRDTENAVSVERKNEIQREEEKAVC